MSYYTDHLEKYRLQAIAWRKAHPKRTRRMARKSHRKLKYGITESDYQELRRKQKGKCAVCGLGGKLEIEHDHSTGQVRGLTHHACNMILGFAKDNPKLLQKAIAYLAKHKGD